MQRCLSLIRLAAPLAAMACSIAPMARADVILSDNLSATSAGTEAATGSTWLTSSFGTGASTAKLTSVILSLANSVSGKAELAVYDDGGLQPGALVGVLTSPTSYSSTLANTTFTASDINLAANSTYWVVLEAQSGEFDWSWIASNTGTGIGFQNTWGNSNDAGATWFIYNIYPTQMRVSIASSSVPEPGPIILCSACAAASLLLRAMFRRHSRADDAAGTVQE